MTAEVHFLTKQENTLPTSMRYDRVQKILEDDRALRRLLSPKRHRLKNRLNRTFCVSQEAIATTNAVNATGRDARKVRKNVILKTAWQLLGPSSNNGQRVGKPGTSGFAELKESEQRYAPRPFDGVKTSFNHVGSADAEVKPVTAASKWPVPTHGGISMVSSDSQASHVLASVASVAGAADDFDPGRFPTEVLPSAMSAMVQAVARAVQVPEALPGCCALAAIGAAIGKGLVIQSGGDRTTRANVYIVVGARSGLGKTLTYNPIMDPIREFETRLEKDWAKAHNSLTAKRAVLNSKIRRLTTKASKAEDPYVTAAITDELASLIDAQQEMNAERPRLFSEDVTSQKLEKLLSASNETLFSASSEAGAILNNLFGRYSGSKRTDENVYVKAYSGDRCRVDRVGRESVTLEAPCLTVLWLMQPEKVAALFGEKSFSEGGLLPRIMPCLLSTDPRDSAPEIGVVPSHVKENWRQSVIDLLEAFHRRRDKPHILFPTENAIASVRHHHEGIIERRRADLADIDIFAARWTEWVWRLSVVHHAAIYGADSPDYPVGAESTEAAIKLVDWFVEQQLGALEKSRCEVRKVNERAVLNLFLHPPPTRPKTAPTNSITAREVQQAHIVNLAVQADTLLDQMEEKGMLISDLRRAQHGGHSVRYYFKAA